MKGFLIALSVLLMTACSTSKQASPTEDQVVQNESGVSEGSTLPPGFKEITRAPLTAADGHEVIVSDVTIEPNTTVPRHYHPGEEFVYVIEGSVVHVEEGKADRILRAGDAVTLAPEVEHAPRGTEEGGRVVVFHVHPEGTPERTFVEDE